MTLWTKTKENEEEDLRAKRNAANEITLRHAPRNKHHKCTLHSRKDG